MKDDLGSKVRVSTAFALLVGSKVGGPSRINLDISNASYCICLDSECTSALLL